MDLRRNLKRMLRIVFAYVAVGVILLLCLCVGLWSAVETSIIPFFTFQRRQNVPVVESGGGTSTDELQSSLKLTTPLCDDTTSECVSPQTFSDSTETVNMAEEKAENQQTKNDEISTKEKFSNLEGLALQMVHLEQCRISADLPRRASSCEFFESPKESSESKPARKGVLKSSCSETKPLPIRGTRRIRFQDQPVYDVSEGSSHRFTSGKISPAGGPSRAEKRKILPPPYLKTGFNFQESPTKSPKPKTCITVNFPVTLQTENAPVIDLSFETGSDQQLANTETDSLSEEVKSTIPSQCSSEADNNEPISIEPTDPLSKELNSSPSSPKNASNKDVAARSMHSLSEKLNSTNLSVLRTKTVTNQQESNVSVETLSKDLSSTNSTTINLQTTNKSMDSLADDPNLTFTTTCKEFEESPEVQDQCSEHGRVEYTLKSCERSLLEQSSEEISTQMKESKVEELHYESMEEETKSTNRKDEDIHELSEKSESENEGENLKEINLLIESTICQQSTKELKNANVSESTSSNELNPAMLKMNKELCMSAVIEDQRETSLENINQRLSEMDAEQLLDASTEERDWTTRSDEDASFETEERKHVSPDVMAEDDVLLSKISIDEQSAEESTFL